jgi:glycosyltransferase involved in cell wall biosynthesis
MKVTGFTFIRNAEKFDYPISEAISSILPLCDIVVVAVGQSDDKTLEIVQALGPKIKIVPTIWDDNLREGGKVLADETNKAMDAIQNHPEWCLYIQGDEVLHENSLEILRKAMELWKDDSRVEGLLVNYKHFYGSYDYIGDAPRWYRKEVRAVRPDPLIRSFRDAQGFRKNNQLLNVKDTDAVYHHYGWVKTPEKQQAKQKSFHRLWHNDIWLRQNIRDDNKFDYSGVDSLIPFDGKHPVVMTERIKNANWEFHFDPATKKLSLKNKLKTLLFKITGIRIGEYRNYKIIP